MGKLLFRIARLKIMGTFVGFVFAYLPFLVPVRKITQNKYAVAFKHPAASYPDHVLIIPRKIAYTVFSLSHQDFLEVIQVAVKIRHGDNRDFVLVINGGKRQDVMQAHFHLLTDNIVTRKGLCNKVSPTVFRDGKSANFNLRDLLRQHGINEESFSIVYQFENGGQPEMFFT